MDPWYVENLVCPVDKSPLTLEGGVLVSQAGRRYPVIDGVPVMLVRDLEQTIGVAYASLDRARAASDTDARAPHLYLESLGISETEKQLLLDLAQTEATSIDPVVSVIVGATSGHSYKHLLGRLKDYPIPELRLPNSGGTTLLDLGCNWGRWCIAAARKGYSVTGIDPSLGAVMAARRVAQQLGLPVRYVVADARYLPFSEAAFGSVFSYSVLQHMSPANAITVLREVRRVLQPEGTSMVQMANRFGARSLYHQLRRGFREPGNFEVRYWSVASLTRRFSAEVGPSTVSADCFFGLGLQKSDKHLMPRWLQLVIELSERLRSLSVRIPALRYVADSVYVQSIKP